MKASDLFIKSLENEGVEYIFGVPGEENLDFLESLRESKIRLILTRHEQGAAFMAATYGRLTGKTGVCLATLGPGATNFVTSAAYAQLGAMPLLMITGQKPILDSKQGGFQIVDIVRMMEPITKMSKQIVNANIIPSLVREAFRTAEQERPGAVHLELPEDIAREESTDSHTFPVTDLLRPQANQQAIDNAVEAIQAAQSPIVLVGAGANRKNILKTLTGFINSADLPFFNTQMGKGAVSCTNPYFLGTAALSSGDYVHKAVEMADLIINIGHDVVEKPPFFMHHDNIQKVIHINFNSATIDEVYFPQIEVIGDIADSLRRIGAKLTPNQNKNLQKFISCRESISKVLHRSDNDERYPMIPQRIVADVRKALPEDGIIALDNGMYKIWFARHYNTYQANTVLLDNALATMGAGLPSAMACALMYPNRQVMAVCGDGGFMMNSQEMETAVRLNLNLVVLIIRDDSYGMIRWKQQQQNLPDFGLEYGNPDFVKYAESYGAYGHRIQSTEQFLPTIKQCYQTGGVHLIEAPVDYSENSKTLIEELEELRNL
jgi:acetolactate synthase-1/2/3 large subunit